MGDASNKPPPRSADQTDISARPFCVFYVDLATPKAINALTVMAAGKDEARCLVAEQHPEGMILHVRAVGSDEESTDSMPVGRACNRALPPLEKLPGARFINGEFRAASSQDDSELDMLGE